MAPRPLTILDITQTGVRLNTEAFNSVLDKVGNKPLVIYSISGATRSGKSYLLNYFIKYFEAQKQNQRQNFDTANSGSDQNWINFQLTSSFVWRSGKERETTGIDIWSEPYFVARGNEKVAVLLMDTQGLFDDKTTARQNAIIFSLTTLCSSVTIFNIMRQVNEDLLQQIQYFSSYAQMVSSDSVEAQHVRHDDPMLVSMTSTDGSLSGTGTEDAPFQNMILLVRDFEVPGYSHGFHRRGRQPEGSSKNFLRDTFHMGRKPENCPHENTIVRTGILQKYQDVSAYLLPDPGKQFKTQVAEPDDDFKDQLKEFIEHLVSGNHLVGKIVDGRPCTGTEFKTFVSKWASIVEKSKETFPEVYTMAENTAFIQYTIAKDASFNCYKDKINTFISDHQKNDLHQKFFNDFKIVHTDALESAIAIYKRLRKFKNPKFDKQFEESMYEDIMQHFDTTYEILKLKGNLEAGSCGGSYVDTETGADVYVENEHSHWLNYYFTLVRDWVVTSLVRLTNIWAGDADPIEDESVEYYF